MKIITFALIFLRDAFFCALALGIPLMLAALYVRWMYGQ